MKSKLNFPNFGSYIFPGTTHTTLESTELDTRTTGGTGVVSPDAGAGDGGGADGGDAGDAGQASAEAGAADAGPPVLLTDWMRQFLQGQVTNAGQ
jgi:hypothetical protein